MLLPERRAAGVTASAWKASAGAASRIPVARAINLTRALKDYAKAGLLVVGLAADGDLELDDLEAFDQPMVLVVGSEGRGLSRLVGEACDLRVSIPMVGGNGVAQRLGGGRRRAGRGRPAAPHQQVQPPAPVEFPVEPAASTSRRFEPRRAGVGNARLTERRGARGQARAGDRAPQVRATTSAGQVADERQRGHVPRDRQPGASDRNVPPTRASSAIATASAVASTGSP